ncbi:helix-turn-helix transcriptional regulator [Kiloniella spongiae]|uniref:helix-turn-helix transcriptional regulator n=1 Tax=Kiloniella spongiae TaxID=1489064 RepID=UPI00069AE8D8|nr:AraC family transcriptional regulator [Kiloniella spongiae]
MRKPFKKADRLSALIQRFHIHARVQNIGRDLLAPEPEPEPEAQGQYLGGQDTADRAVDEITGRATGQVATQMDIATHENVLRLKPESDGAPNITCAGLPIGAANFFVVQRGQISSSAPELNDLESDVPLLVFYPRGVPHDFKIISREPFGESDLGEGHITNGFVCAVVDTGGEANPIALALPDLVIVRLDQSAPLRAVTDILLEEAIAPRCGGRAVIDRLCEIVVIRLLRHLIEAGHTEVGLLAGLADPNISLAIIAMHDNPNCNYNLEDLAEISAMSRTHFANSFRKLVGVTPGQYLSNWRLTLARTELSRGVPLKAIAGRIGFSSSAALSRAFTRRYGFSPKQEMLRG